MYASQRFTGLTLLLAVLASQGLAMARLAPRGTVATAGGSSATTAHGAPDDAPPGTLVTSQGPGSIELKSHKVLVTIDNGFARTEVVQTFFNPGAADLEAVYSFHMPKGAYLSEMSIDLGQKVIRGEVLAKEQATKVYEEERSKGHDAGLAVRDGYKAMEFAVSPVRAHASTVIRTVYYESLSLDEGVGRYVYPVEDGGTQEGASSFWQPNTVPASAMKVEVDLRSAWPVAEIRMPGHEKDAVSAPESGGNRHVSVERKGDLAGKDFVFYYRLADNLPGRAELVPYRADPTKPGTFMLVLTPGIDLAPLHQGTDLSFVLDVSGSMETKLPTLCKAVEKALGQLSPGDRFRISTFNGDAHALVKDWTVVTPNSVQSAIAQLETLRAGGSTNVYAGLQLGLEGCDADRATAVVLVTDGVTNTGVVDPAQFHQLLRAKDVRVHVFIMGNDSNWPLVETICKASGGFFTSVSNDDDIVGPLLLARQKLTHESLTDAAVEISGVPVSDLTGAVARKVYFGQQVAVFGHYAAPGEATLNLRARITGKEHVYTTHVRFPALDTHYPEIERLFAMRHIDELTVASGAGLVPADQATRDIRDLGLAYQLVTDQTAMAVASDDAFAVRGIDRQNLARAAIEDQATGLRLASGSGGAPVQVAGVPVVAAPQPPPTQYVDHSAPMFPSSAPSLGHGGGAIDPLSAALALGLAGMGVASRRRRTDAAATRRDAGA